MLVLYQGPDNTEPVALDPRAIVLARPCDFSPTKVEIALANGEWLTVYGMWGDVLRAIVTRKETAP